MASISPPRYSIVKDLTANPKHPFVLAAKHQYLENYPITVNKKNQKIFKISPLNKNIQKISELDAYRKSPRNRIPSKQYSVFPGAGLRTDNKNRRTL